MPIEPLELLDPSTSLRMTLEEEPGMTEDEEVSAGPWTELDEDETASLEEETAAPSTANVTDSLIHVRPELSVTTATAESPSPDTARR